MMVYEPVIGMEVHAELATQSKMFCGCSASVFGARPNSVTCPVCLGLPGALPVVNRAALEYGIAVALALDCHISDLNVFARKNYTYPDLPKGYQISQFDLPVGTGGWIDVIVDGAERRVGITRVHLEEDTAKLAHLSDSSLIDFNRSGLPLLEIVSEPDIRSGEEARQYLMALRQLLRYLGVGSGDMEKGAMRCEANISIRPIGEASFGTKVEVKNLNSFRSVKMALEYEIERQARLLDAGGVVEQVTVGWDEVNARTVVQRSKESAHDYRYFPEPDIPPVRITSDVVEKCRVELPELPGAKVDRFVAQHDLKLQQALVLSQDREIADFFERAVAALNGSPMLVANWVTGDLMRLLRDAGLSVIETQLTPESLADLLRLVDRGTIHAGTGKTVLAEMVLSGRSAEEIVDRDGLAQISDEDRLVAAVELVLLDHPDAVSRYFSGKTQVVGWLLGQVMRQTDGVANPHMVRDLLAERLEVLRKQRQIDSDDRG
jgi:aspartyl-tRNA(Asn)/glutamyl-tRNA(Gln) amidotransferase subunit B